MQEELVAKAVEKLHETFDSTSLDIEWKKMEQKFEEAKYNPGDVKPLADCIFSILLAARSQGFKVGAVMAALDGVAENCLHSRWKKMGDGTYQSV